MGLSVQSPVQAGQSFQATYSFGRSKAGGAVALIPGGPRSLYAVEADCGSPYAGGKNKYGQCSPTLEWYLHQLGALATAPISGVSGTATLVAPAQPGTYGVVSVYAPDGGTIDTVSLVVAAAPPPPPPPPESGTRDTGLGMGTNLGDPANPDPCRNKPMITLEAWVTKYRGGVEPGMMYAQVQVPDCPEGPSRSGVSPVGTPSNSYIAPSPEPEASDGQKLSMQGADVQAYYVGNYGPGILAATQFVIDHNHQLATIGSSTIPTSQLPAGPGVGGADVGLGPTPNTSWTNTRPVTTAPPPAAPLSPGGLGGLLQDRTVLVVAAIAAIAFVANRR